MIFWSVILGIVVLWSFITYLWHLPTDVATARRKLAGRDLYARHVLEQLLSPEHAYMSGNRRYCRRVTLNILPYLLSDMRSQAHWRRPASIAAMAIFYCVYGLTWAKAKTWPGKSDLRGALGVQLLFLP